jgi:hypothetical protein
MPSIVHEAPMELIRQHVELVRDLVHAVCDLSLDDAVTFELASTDASKAMGAQYLADGVVVAKDKNDEPLLAVIIEVQGRDAHAKRFSWPVYLCQVRGQHKCDALLLVICWNPDEVEKCRQTIRTGHPGFDLTPVVIHPGSSFGGCTGESGSYLVLFAGCIGAIDLDTEDGQDLVLEAARQLPDASRRTCITLILAVASEAARHAMEAKMATPAYRNEFIESFVAQGKAEGIAEGKAEGIAEGKAEGIAEGEAKALASSITKLLARRHIHVDEKRVEQIRSCSDVNQLDAWFNAAVTARTADEVFNPSVSSVPNESS